jgi:hypothetical protein
LLDDKQGIVVFIFFSMWRARKSACSNSACYRWFSVPSQSLAEGTYINKTKNGVSPTLPNKCQDPSRM